MNFDNKDILKKVKSMKDKLGTPIDSNIFNLVYALNIHGFKTLSSCEGHINKNNISFYPYVTIGEKKSNHIETYKSNIKELNRLIALLSDFYKDREVYYENMIICSASWSTAGLIELRPNNGLISSINKTIIEKEKIHNFYIKEFDNFAKYLIRKAEN